MLPLRFQLLDDPIGEPGLLLYLGGHTILFDAPLTLYDRILKSSTLNDVMAILISHRHRDHFGGIDRLFFESPHFPLVIGNKGIHHALHQRLNSYDLNLIQFEIQTKEVTWTSKPEVVYNCVDYQIEAIALNHGSIHSIAYAIQEHAKIKVNKSLLKSKQLPSGPWIRHAKEAIKNACPPQFIDIAGRQYPFVCIQDVFFVEKGKRIVYATDFDISDSNTERMLPLLQQTNHFFCEAAYLQEDRDLAIQNNHQTSVSAAKLAAQAHVETLHLFHHSRRYQRLENAEEVFIGQAKEYFPNINIES